MGVSLVSLSAMVLNHLFFADDNLLFCKANSLEWSRFIHLLESYEKALGQLLSKDKTSIFFSKNTPQRSKLTSHKQRGLKLLGGQKNTWVSQLSQEDLKLNPFKLYLIKHGTKYPIGTPNFCQWLGKKLCSKLNGDNTKIEWMEWSKLGFSKDTKGLSLHDMDSFNVALLSMQAWRILKAHSSLVSKVFRQI